VGWAVGGWAAAAALFHVWTAYAGVWEPRQMRATHLLFLLPLASFFVLGTHLNITVSTLVIFGLSLLCQELSQPVPSIGRAFTEKGDRLPHLP